MIAEPLGRDSCQKRARKATERMKEESVYCLFKSATFLGSLHAELMGCGHEHKDQTEIVRGSSSPTFEIADTRYAKTKM